MSQNPQQPEYLRQSDGSGRAATDKGFKLKSDGVGVVRLAAAVSRRTRAASCHLN